MKVSDAIYNRRAVRAYTDETPNRHTIEKLIETASQAPSAMNTQPWEFAVIQDHELLQRISGCSKSLMLENLPLDPPNEEMRRMLSSTDFNIFYDAGTLIIICACDDTQQAAEDCCLAAQNLMLAAHEIGLATCPIGFARPWLNQAEAKREIGIPETLTVVFPLILGYPREVPHPHGRKDPVIVVWKE